MKTTNEEYFGKLRSAGWTKRRIIPGEVRAVLLEGPGGELATIQHPDDLDAEERAFALSRFFRTHTP